MIVGGVDAHTGDPVDAVPGICLVCTGPTSLPCCNACDTHGSSLADLVIVLAYAKAGETQHRLRQYSLRSYAS